MQFMCNISTGAGTPLDLIWVETRLKCNSCHLLSSSRKDLPHSKSVLIKLIACYVTLMNLWAPAESTALEIPGKGRTVTQRRRNFEEAHEQMVGKQSVKAFNRLKALCTTAAHRNNGERHSLHLIHKKVGQTCDNNG
jgi:hypothetical protein